MTPSPRVGAATRPPLVVSKSPRGTVDSSLVAAALGGLPQTGAAARLDPKRAHAGLFAAVRRGGPAVTQRMTVATLLGDSSAVVIRMFDHWRGSPDPAGVDRFCAALRENGLSLPVAYFAEWVDRWSMGDTVPGPRALHGKQFEAACLPPAEAITWADTRSEQFPEYQWFASRLREAATAWTSASESGAVVVLRDVIGVSSSDDDVMRSRTSVPSWLASLGHGGIPTI